MPWQRNEATCWDVIVSSELTLKNSWCCRQDASGTPCKQPAETLFLFFWDVCILRQPFPFCSTDPFHCAAAWGHCLVRCSGEPQHEKKKSLAQTDNPQVGPVYPKVKEQAKANSLFSLQRWPRVRTWGDNNGFWVHLSNRTFMEVEWWCASLKLCAALSE